MDRLTHLFQKGKEENDRPLDESEVATGLERRKKFLRYLNRGWLVLGIVTLVTLPLFPKLRGEFIFLIAVTFPTYLIVRFLNLSGRTRLAGVVFTLCVNFSFYSLFMLLVGQLGANEAFRTQSTVWMLMGLAVLFAGAFVDKWAAPGLAAFNTFLLIGTRLLIAPGSDPRPSALVLWWMLALTIWLYESTLDQALAQVLGELRERKQAEEEVRRRVETMTALYETTHDLVIERDLSQLLHTIVERATRLLNAAGGGLYLCEPELGQVRCVVSYNTPRDFTGTVLKYGEGAAGRVAQTMEPLIVNDYSAWEGRAKIYEKERPFSAVLSVPMKWQNEVIGVIHVLEFQKEHLFTEDDLNLVTSFANQAAIAVHNARMYSLAQQELAERKAAEAALLESEQRFRGLSEAAFEGILIHDEGIIQDANQVFADLVGYRGPEDLIGKNGLETLPFTPESLERIRRNLSSGLTEPLEITVIRPDGSTYPAETQGRDITFKGRKLRVVAMRDITERKRMEDALRESEVRFSSIFRASPIWISVTGLDSGQFTLVNDAFSNMSGYTREEVIGRTTLELNIWADPHDRDRLVETLREQRRMRDFETRLRTKSGEIRNVLMSSELIDLSGQLYVVSLAYDITERKRTEEALRFTQFAIDHSADSTIWLAKETGQVIYVNDAACSMLGYSREELLSLTAFDVDPNVPPADWQKNFEILKSQGSIHFESSHKTKSGQMIPVDVTANYVEFGGQIYNCAFIRDITERKKAEEQLRESEKQYRSLFENMLEGYAYCKMLFVDNVAQDFIYIDVNPAFQVLTGLKNIIGQRVSQVIPGIQESNPELFEIYGRVALTGQPEKFETYVPALKIWFSISVFCPAKEYFVAIFDNITERKHFEEAQQKLNAELEARVAQRTAQLETANKELEAFSYSVSHDLRAPLRAIDGFSRILMEDHAPQFSGETQRYLEQIRESSQRMGRLINDLLMLSQVTRQVLRYAAVDLSGLAQTIVSELRDSAPERSVEFVIATGLVAQGDPGLLQIVMQNLLNNAWKFTGKREHARIEFGSNLQTDGSRIYFVRDNGAGFNPDNAEKLFGAFQRLHSESEFEGTGIGLATVQRVISRHGGKVWAEGEIEKGATFYFTFDRA